MAALCTSRGCLHSLILILLGFFLIFILILSERTLNSLLRPKLRIKIPTLTPLLPVPVRAKKSSISFFLQNGKRIQYLTSNWFGASIAARSKMVMTTTSYGFRAVLQNVHFPSLITIGSCASSLTPFSQIPSFRSILGGVTISSSSVGPLISMPAASITKGTSLMSWGQAFCHSGESQSTMLQ